MRRYWEPAGTLALLALLALVLLHGSRRQQVEIAFATDADAAGRLQVYYAADGGFSEAASRWYAVQPGTRQTHRLHAPGRALTHLRIDPAPGMRISVCGVGMGRSVPEVAYRVAGSQDARAVRSDDCLRIDAEAAATDPWVRVVLEDAALRRLERASAWETAARVAAWALVLALLLLAVRHRARWRDWRRTRPALHWLRAVDRQAHWVCAGLMLSFGALYALGTPPGAVPDEEAHLSKIVRIGSGVPFGDSGERALPSVHGMYGPFRGYLRNKAAFTEQQREAQVAQPLDCEPSTTALSKAADSYFPHQYALPSAAFAATCATGGSFGTFLYGARLLNLLLATALAVFGVAMAVRGKWALLLVAALPMSLYQVASLSADSLGIGLGIAWIGLTSGLAAGRIGLRRATPLLWTLALAIGLLKPGSAWVLASLLFCGEAFRREGRSFARGHALLVLRPWLLHVGWALLSMGGAPLRADVDPAVNLATLTREPLLFLRLCWETFFGGHGKDLFRMMVGILGWLDVPLHAWVYPASAVALVAAAFATEDTPRAELPPWVRLLAFACCAGSILLLSLIMFVQWTPPGSPRIDGLQGRYFLPHAAFLLTWCGWRAPDALRAAAIPLIVLVAIAANVDALARLQEAYFVTGR